MLYITIVKRFRFMMKTGKDLGIFGGLLAIVIGYFIISAGLSLLKYGDYPPPRLNQKADEPETEPSGENDIFEIIIIVAGTACITGGAVGFIGGCLANTSPRNARALMFYGGCIAALSIAGALVLAAGAKRARNFANAPPGTEPEWEDGEAMQY
jgi:hypothetical protein